MKNLLLFIMISALIIGCGKSETEQKSIENGNTISEVKKPAGPVIKLKYKFKVGDKFSYKLQTISNNIEEIYADTTIKNDITQRASYTFDFKVKSVNDYKLAEVEAKIKSIIAETTFNGQTMKYDSKFIYSSREKAQYVDYEAVKNIPFQLSVDELGNVVKVDGINRIMKNILEIQNVPDTLSAKTREKMKANIANGTLQPLTQQIFKVVSNNPVGVDSVWQIKFDTPLAVFKVENTAIYRVDNISFEEDSTASVVSDLLINVIGDGIVSEQGLRYTFSKPQLTANGNFTFNNSRGLVKMAESVTKLEMTMMMEGVDAKNQPIKSTKRDVSNNTNIVELL
ncbi:MAG: DUF6263 family protein [Melioribacteraceae bacterium]|nr:DUF6263 family protein [Melioribacteraceae bacterium]